MNIYIASLFSSSISDSNCLLVTFPSSSIISKLATETSYATFTSDVPSSYFFSYCLDCTLPIILTSVPTGTFSQNLAFLPHAKLAFYICNHLMLLHLMHILY